MALFEVHIRTAKFLAAQRQTLLSREFCIPEQNLGGTSIFVHRVRVGANSLRQNAPTSFDVWFHDGSGLAKHGINAEGFQLQIVQELTFEVSSAEAVYASPNRLVATTALPITIVTDVYYEPSNAGGCVLRMQFRKLEWVTPPPAFPGVDVDAITLAVKALITARMGTTEVPFNFTSMLPPNMGRIAMAGVSMTGDGDVVAFRVDPFGAPRDIPWTNFHRGAFGSRLPDASHDWACFIDQSTLIPKFNTSVEQTLKRKALPKTKVISVFTDYQVNNGKPRMVTTINANVGLGPFTDHVELKITSAMSLTGQPPQLTVDIDLGDIKDYLDSISELVDVLKFVLPQPLGLIVELSAGDSLDKASASVTGASVVVGGMSCTQVSDTRHRCVAPVSAPGLNNVSMSVADLTAMPDGIAIGGKLTVLNYTPSDVEAFTAAGGDELDPRFGWRPPHVSCGQMSNRFLEDVRADLRSSAVLYWQLDLLPTGSSPLYLCAAEMVSGPAPGPLVTAAQRLPATVRVEITGRAAARYLENPVPIDVLIRTTAGVVLARIAPPPPVESMRAFIEGSVKAQVLACPNLPGWFRKGMDKFDIRWIENPLLDPDYQTIIRHRREIEIQGVKEGTQVTAEDSVTALLLAMSHATRDGVVRLATDQSATTARGLVMRVASLGDVSSGTPGLVIRQQSVYGVAAAALAAPLRHFVPATRWQDTATAVTDTGVMVVDLSHPDRPQRLTDWQVDGLVDAVDSPAGLVIAGADRLLTVGADMVATVALEASDAIRAVSADETGVFVVTDAGVEIRDLGDLTLRATHALTGATSITTVDDQIIVGSTHGLHAFTYRDGALGDVTTLSSTGVADLTRNVSLGFNALTIDGGVQQFLVGGGAVVAAETAVGEPDPMVRLGDTVVYGQPGDQWLQIGRLAAPRLVPALPFDE